MQKGLTTYVCYRQEESWELAKLVQKAFIREKFDIYLDEKDRTNYTQKDVDREINNHLKDSDIVLIIISRDTLKHCVNNEKDWMYQEIKYAIEKGKVIIPLINDTKFNIPDGLPKLFSNLNEYNAVFISEKHLENCLANVFKFIVETEYKFLRNPQRIDVPRIDNPKYTSGDIKDWTEKEIDAEVERLKSLDGTTEFDLDKKIYNQVFSKYKKINVLQVGCGNGFFAQQILKDYEQKWIDKGLEPQVNFVGVDINKNKIKVAKKLFEGNSRYSFETIDLFKDYSIDEVKKLASYTDEDGIEREMKFDVIICRFLLNNFEDPNLLLENLRELLNDKPELDFGSLKVQINDKLTTQILTTRDVGAYNKAFEDAVRKPISPYNYEAAKSEKKSISVDNAFDLMQRVKSTCVKACGSVLNKVQAISTGTIIVTEIDDGFDLYSPDKNNLFTQFYMLLSRSPKSGNRYSGREVYGWLREAEYTNCQLHNLILNEPSINIDNPTSPIVSEEQRIARFKNLYNKLLEEYKGLVEDKKTCLNKFYNQAYQWLLMNRDTLIYELKNPDFFYTTSYIIWTASK